MSERPRIAALGGGTGLASLLRGLKRAPVDLTAIVTMADDESLLGRLFQHRFADGELSGHPFGNLFLAALAEVTGSFDLAVEECSHVLKISGQVVPSTLSHSRLWAERVTGEEVCGETMIAAGPGACRRVWLDPEPPAHEPAVRAILEADLVLLGPGSLFTSVLAHLAVPDLARAVADAPGTRAYVCNVMTQPGETDDFDAAEHVDRVMAALPGGLDVAIVHDGPREPDAVAMDAAGGQQPVEPARERVAGLGVRVVAADVAEAGEVVRHSPDALAAVLVALAAESARAGAR
ncbi:MAG: gluconeogenesis factor YvcK family protein [Miltoncostaeaceae bacterium]